jgi:PAS domain S-box-containing protein
MIPTGERAADTAFGGSGEIQSLCRSIDWGSTLLGNVDGWPETLRTAVRICLDATTTPMALWAGPDLTLIYNQAYALVLGPAKHPAALGRPGSEVWPEFWDRLGPQLRRIMAPDESAHNRHDWPAPIRGDRADPFLTRHSFTPVRDQAGRVAGLLDIVPDAQVRLEGTPLVEDFLSSALTTARTGAWELDLVNHSTRRSLQHDRIFGYEDVLPSWTYEMFLQHVMPEDREEVDRTFRHGLESRRDWSLQCRILRADGEIRWIWAAGRHVFDDGGEHQRMAGVVQDITERKHMEELLRASETLARQRLMELETLYETAPIGLCVFDEHLRWARVNRVIAEINGRSIEEHIGKTPSEVVPDVGAQAEAALREILRTGERLDFEMHGTTSAQPGVQRAWSEHWVPIKDDDGRIVGISVAAEEITDRKRAAEALAESEERFRTLADNIAQFAWMADEAGSIFWYNKRWHDYTGTTLEEVRGWGWRTVHHPDHVQRVVDKIRHCFDTGQPWEDTFPLRGKNGEYRWFLSRAIPIRDNAGNVVRWFGTNTDVTEQRAAEEALRDSESALRVSEAALRESDRHKSEFLAWLSHELRNPLGVARGSVATIERAGLHSEYAKRALPVVDRQLAHMGRLLDDLLDLTRIAKGKILLDRASFELNDIVRLAGEDFRQVLETQGIEFDVRVTDTPLRSYIDATRIAQVVGNLLQNAGKFTPKGGCVWLSLCSSDNAHAVITVTDDGAGLSPEMLERVFEPLVQDSRTIQRSQGGLGLGLALVRALVELHGGQVNASSDGPGRGSTFRVWLPLE